MSIINLLPEQIYNKIAAGEVVERPASVLKELLENSLDAHAHKIMVHITKAGTDMIAVTDDGSGMDPDDALLCFEAHATSKISSESDLFSIRTMGFRGEALPSIASVSKITLRTRRQELPEGCEVIIQGGKMLSAKPAGCAPGTEIIVRDLFFNTPARKKFMRSRGTEEHHIAEMMTNLALAHIDISFELKIDNRIFLSSASGKDPMPRIRDLFGREYADALIPLQCEEHGVSISGFIAKRSFTRPTRTEQRLFVNGRPVDAQGIYRAIREGCGPVLDKGRYQPCILFITLDPSLVDVNVHPAKREVRFAREFEIIAAVRNAVSEAMRQSDTSILSMGTVTAVEPDDRPDTPLAPQQMFSPEKVAPAPFADLDIHAVAPEPAPELAHNQREYPEAEQPVPEEPDLSTIDRVLRSALLDYTPQCQMTNLQKASELPGFNEAVTKAEQHVPEVSHVEPAPPKHASLGLRVIGILNNTYIIAEKEDGLILIDQHAAHERVLFERILKGVDGSLSQRLLIPVTLELTRAEVSFVLKNTEQLIKLGFEAEPFGSNTIKLNAIPAALTQDSSGTMFKDMISNLIAGGTPAKVEYDQIAMAACKAAVKANDVLTMDEALSLLRQLGNCDLPFACPHGRPTILNISMREIERRFGRK